MKKTIFMLLFVALGLQQALAQNFTFDGLKYTVTSPTTASVARIPEISGAITIPAEVEYYDYGASVNYRELSVTSIDDQAFFYCSGLTSVTIPNSVTSIGTAAFSGCSGLTSVIIPNSVNSIGDYAFSGCSGLTSVTIGNSVTSIGHSVFRYCSGLTSVTIPNSVTSIGHSVFDNCYGLTSVTIPNSVTSIGESAFYYCYRLTSVTIPYSITSIGESAFAYSGLTSVTIPSSVTSIGESAFAYSDLTSVTIPNSVTSIGDYAFRGCSDLTSVVCEIEIPLLINSTIFQDVNQGACILTVPAGSIAAYKAADVWWDFAPFTCATPTENTTTVTACNSYTWNGIVYTTSGFKTARKTNCLTEKLDLTIITLTEQTNFSSGGLNYVVTSPTTVALGNNSGASGSIIIPDSVSSHACFSYKVTSINARAFESCSGFVIP